ncbi:MAG: succinate dehydrogenase, hydrophobic membrane anchor protein [Gammaproteobacteria bacterium]|nr:succinate dehydrogenase, hydrophobic membrane anchor protein [Gammaproteobacteria bacterium]MDH5593701.1 succinate dehydrogenase, hydrophobic membrane anchor protein [Gammaproteobacteria bacterium]
MTLHAHGLRAWLLQRMSALYMTGYTFFVLFLFSSASISDYQNWHSWMADPFFSLATTIFFAALLVHAWVGIRDVIMDYAHSSLLRFILLTATGLSLFSIGIWMLRVVILVVIK